MLARTARTLRLIPVLAVFVALAALLALGACSTAVPATGSNEGEATEQNRSVDTDAATDGTVSTALVAEVDGGILFIGQDSGEPYMPTLPEGQIFDADGEQINEGDLKVGNVVRVTGNGIMLESYPGQYPGITKVEVIDEGSPENLEPYEKLLAELASERDPAEPPSAIVEYRSDSAVVSVMLPIYGYTWSFEQNDETQTTIADAPHPTQYDADELNDVVVDAPTEVTVICDEAATGAVVERWSEEDISAAAKTAGSAQALDTSELTAQEVDAELADDGTLTLTVEPGYRYSLTVEFDAGTVTYAFTVRSAA